MGTTHLGGTSVPWRRALAVHKEVQSSNLSSGRIASHLHSNLVEIMSDRVQGLPAVILTVITAPTVLILPQAASSHVFEGTRIRTYQSSRVDARMNAK